MRLGYNTNGFPHHRLEDTLHILADLGYESVAITLDYHALNPFDADLHEHMTAIRSLLDRLRLSCVIETGARFLLDPWRKHQPTLLCRDVAGRERRREFLSRAIHIAEELHADAVSLWSGSSTEPEAEEVLWDRLIAECRMLADFAAEHNTRLALEPEPGMFIDTLAKFQRLSEAIAHAAFGLTIDIGHLHCMAEGPIPDRLRAWQHCLWNVHIEDMRQGVHEHLFFGEGEIAFEPILRTLHGIYCGGVHVELSRHGHDAVNVARRAREFLMHRLPAS